MRGRLVVKAWGRPIPMCGYGCNREGVVLLVTYGWICLKCAERFKRDLDKTMTALKKASVR